MKITTRGLLLAMSTFPGVPEGACGDGCSLLLSRSTLKELWWAAGEAANTLKPQLNTISFP